MCVVGGYIVWGGSWESFPALGCLTGGCPAGGRRSRGGCRVVACACADVRLTEREYMVSVVFAIANWVLIYAIRVVCVEAVIISVDSFQHSFATSP